MTTSIAEQFRSYLNTAAAKAGITDLGDLTIEGCAMEQTWGDKMGLFFAGAYAERAAVCFTKWATRERLGSSYAAQHCLGDVVPFHRSVCTNGAIHHGAGAALEVPNYYADEAAEYLAKFTVTPGVAVSYVYYAGAD